jgi:hypothetical protein
MEQTTKPFAGTAELPKTISSERPSPLPYCPYPKESAFLARILRIFGPRWVEPGRYAES